jgi:ABC-type dipeptide/oligopeptide/nickel transport system ATPase component
MNDPNEVAWDADPLSVRDLGVEYIGERGMVKAVRGVSFDLRPRESLALIGESGTEGDG